VRYPKRKLVLFFSVQALAVAVMIILADPEPSCDPLRGCDARSAASVILPILLLLGELVVIANALRADPRVWHGLLALGLVSLVIALICLATFSTQSANRAPRVLAVWHLALGLLLAGVGATAGVADLIERWRRPNDFGPEDERSSGMWPFD
jgi:hypothetical protein